MVELELDSERYPSWDQPVAGPRRDDVMAKTHVSPFFTDPSEKRRTTGATC